MVNVRGSQPFYGCDTNSSFAQIYCGLGSWRLCAYYNSNYVAIILKKYACVGVVLLFPKHTLECLDSFFMTFFLIPSIVEKPAS